MGLLSPLAALAGTSAHYSLAPITIDTGGLPGASASYTVSFITQPGGAGSSANYSTRSGFGGQLSGPFATGVILAATPLTVDENGARQLVAALLYDDTSTTPLPAEGIDWSVTGGPLTGISATGLATGGIVFEDTAATVRGMYEGMSADLGITVLNVDADNYLSYGGDGLEDLWQVDYFGLPPNALAGPNVDADGDGQDNRLENLAGVDPTDVGARFQMRIQPASVTRVTFSPVLGDRTYTLISRTAVVDWHPQPGVTEVNVGDERMFTDTQPTEREKIYRIEITKP